MPLYRFPPGMSQESLQRRGLVERALIVILLVLSQHTFDIISLFFGGLSVYFICAGIPIRAWQSSQRRLGFVSGDDIELKAHRLRVSIALATIHGFLLVNWFGAVMRCRWLARRRRIRAGHWENPQNKAVIQVDDPASDLGVNWPADQASGAVFIQVRRRIRSCEHCGRIADRMYHCEQLGKCLPVFNHFCGVLNVPVYLETVKPYLCFLFLLCLDGLFVVGSCVWTWSDKQLRSTAVEGTLLFLVIVNFLHAGLMLAYVGTTMAFHNVVNSERGRGGQFRGTYMAAQEEVPAGVIVRIRWLANNPWDLGKWNNFCALMGGPFSWLIWWRMPLQVRRYGRHILSDLPLTEAGQLSDLRQQNWIPPVAPVPSSHQSSNRASMSRVIVSPITNVSRSLTSLDRAPEPGSEDSVRSDSAYIVDKSARAPRSRRPYRTD